MARFVHLRSSNLQCTFLHSYLKKLRRNVKYTRGAKQVK